MRGDLSVFCMRQKRRHEKIHNINKTLMNAGVARPRLQQIDTAEYIDPAAGQEEEACVAQNCLTFNLKRMFAVAVPMAPNREFQLLADPAREGRIGR
jgi:hypothetical protein